MARHQHTGAKHGICAFRQTSENFFMWPHLQSKYDTTSSPVMQPSYLYFESRIVMYSKNNFQKIRTHLLLIVCHHSGWWVALGKGLSPAISLIRLASRLITCCYLEGPRFLADPQIVFEISSGNRKLPALFYFGH